MCFWFLLPFLSALPLQPQIENSASPLVSRGYPTAVGISWFLRLYRRQECELGERREWPHPTVPCGEPLCLLSAPFLTQHFPLQKPVMTFLAAHFLFCSFSKADSQALKVPEASSPQKQGHPLTPTETLVRLLRNRCFLHLSL